MDKSTQLRYVFSKNPDKIVEWVNNLPFKIEVKSGPIVSGGKFYLFFILAERLEKPNTPFLGGNLDG